MTALPSGVQYSAIKTGQGGKPSENDTVLCRFKASLADGTVFDASPGGDRTTAIQVKSAVPGLREVLKMMPMGSKWLIVVPSEQGYGWRGNGNGVGPDATLIYDIELVGIK